MKIRMGWLVLAGLLLTNVNGFSRDKNFYIFLAFGQSNMEGYPNLKLLNDDDKKVDKRYQMLAAVDFPSMDRKKGSWYDAVPPLCRQNTGLCPVDYFGRTLVSNLPAKIRVGVVNVAVAGCKIEMFQKSEYQSYSSNAPGYMKGIIRTYEGNPYARLVEMGKLAQKDGVIKGILLHQGESNPNDQQWANKVKSIYDDLLKDLDLKAKDVPLLAGETVNADQRGVCAGMNKYIDDLPKTIPTAHVISSAGCACRQEDHLHFSPEGYRELGTRYGVEMLTLLGYKAPKSK